MQTLKKIRKHRGKRMTFRRIAPQIGLDAMDYERFDLVLLEKSGKNSRLLWKKTGPYSSTP